MRASTVVRSCNRHKPPQTATNRHQSRSTLTRQTNTPSVGGTAAQPPQTTTLSSTSPTTPAAGSMAQGGNAEDTRAGQSTMSNTREPIRSSDESRSRMPKTQEPKQDAEHASQSEASSESVNSVQPAPMAHFHRSLVSSTPFHSLHYCRVCLFCCFSFVVVVVDLRCPTHPITNMVCCW
jgi:hypothetical protein